MSIEQTVLRLARVHLLAYDVSEALSRDPETRSAAEFRDTHVTLFCVACRREVSAAQEGVQHFLSELPTQPVVAAS